MTAAGPPTPPAGGGSGDDPFGWLYRRGEMAPTEDAPPLVPPTVEAPPVTPGPTPQPPAPTPPPPQAFAPPPPVQQQQPVQQPLLPPQPPPYEPPLYQPPPAYVPPPEPRRRRGVVVGVVVGVILLAAIAAGVVVAFVLRSPDRNVALDPASSAPSTAPSKPSGPAPVKPVATGVNADCTAAPATDDAGSRVGYDAGNVLDTQTSTAWRCDGNGVGHALTFSFPAGATFTKVGLINGYAKTDPKSGAKRYPEYRRITRVTWTFDDGTVISQKLSDRVQKTQSVAVPSLQAQTVKLTIEASTSPGSSAKTRDAVLISGVTFG